MIKQRDFHPSIIINRFLLDLVREKVIDLVAIAYLHVS